MRRTLQLSGVLAVVIASAIALAACGSDSDDSSDENASSAGESGSATTAPEPRTTPPTEIPITDPLSAPPEKGKTFYWLQCELPVCATIAEGMKAAVAAAGWKYEAQVFKASDPGAGLESALQRKPDAIGITGIPSEAVKPQLADAAKAEIPVVTCATPEKPSPTTYGAVCGSTTGPDGENLALWAIQDSKGKANIVSVTVPSFPSLATTTNGTKDTAAKYCPDCTTDTLDVTVDDIGTGQVAPKVIAYLQSNPDVNYVLFVFADLANGVPEALEAAGLSDKVKLIGNGATSGQFQGVADGTQAAWGAYPYQYQGFVMMDGALRLTADGKLPDGYEEKIESNPTYIVDSPEAADELAPKFEWPGPANYEEQFKTLWNVG